VITFFILSPFAIAPLAAWLVSRYSDGARFLAVWPAIVATVLALELGATLTTGARVVETAWAPAFGLTLAFNLDGLGLLFALLITVIGALVVLYASSYLHGHRHLARFYGSLFAFMGAMLGVALSDNVLTLFVFWELTGFTSFLLIGFEHERDEARASALQALLVTGAGGLALLAAGVLLINVSGTSSLSAMASNPAVVAGHPMYVAIAILVLAAAFTKSAQVPFHFWLPNAMAAPTPVSAYLHSATMVKAGVYLIARMTPILGGTFMWTTTVTLVGAATMVVGAYRSVQETDLKRILAYSTLSALGVLTMLLGVGTQETVAAALVYLVAHAAYKGALFLVAGAVDHETGTRDITALHGLGRAMPFTAAAGGIAALSMAGAPLTLGFVGKDGAYEALLHAGEWSGSFLALTVFASILLGLAGLLAGVVPFRGAPASGSVHEAGWRLWMPPLALAVTGIVVGVAPSLLNAPLAAAASAVLNTPTDLSLAIWHGFSPALGLSAVTLLGVAAAYARRDDIRGATWRPAYGTEQIYRGVIAVLTSISTIVAPPLHSASLRSYVMVIVVTSMVVVGAALASDPNAFFATTPDPDVQPHELLIVIVIIAGAVAAAMAKTTMAAVLALGVVGYGVATTFLLFGAPDLAMTQFSVETLTVLIYVLVFRHFRDLGALSPRSVRYRDALIAIGMGTFIGASVLLVSTAETPPRLRDYFAEFAPVLGHGRNIVNVILVDFRALDTMGEITVLATAAIGVRALLGLAAAEKPEKTMAHRPELSSAIFRTAARLLMPLLLLFALFLMLRGHNEPGGGFVGGLVAAAAFSLYAIAFGVPNATRALPVSPLTLLGAGLLVAVASGIPAALRGQPFLTAVWMLDPVTLGTPLLFDLGVFLVVTGVVLMMIFSLGEES
jgi:multicomponent Na+:H+ antiporter subunit A